jgi:hypothetical protein
VLLTRIIAGGAPTNLTADGAARLPRHVKPAA